MIKLFEKLEKFASDGARNAEIDSPERYAYYNLMSWLENLEQTNIENPDDGIDFTSDEYAAGILYDGDFCHPDLYDEIKSIIDEHKAIIKELGAN